MKELERGVGRAGTNPPSSVTSWIDIRSRSSSPTGPGSSVFSAPAAYRARRSRISPSARGLVFGRRVRKLTTRIGVETVADLTRALIVKATRRCGQGRGR